MGRLHYGDNLDVLRASIADESVDLVYLDPPFNSNQDYNVLSGVKRLARPGAAVRAFGDTWTWSPASEEAYAQAALAGGKVAIAMDALRRLTGESDMLAYLAMMAPRLVELRRVLSPGGSIYLHCDPTASHYLKVLMDAVFGPQCFRNEVIWRYRRWPARSRQFQKMHDVLLFYSRSPGGAHFWRTLYGYEELAESTRKTFGTKRQVADFSSGHRKPNKLDVESPGPPLSDVWDIGIIAPSGRERLGYPTQKPEALLERIILASSPEGGTVLDPFCGSGTSLIVAARHGRRFIGIDTTYVAVNLVRRRFRDALGEAFVPAIIGAPGSPEDAALLAERNPEQFRLWALSLAGAAGAEAERTASGDPMGFLFFSEGAGSRPGAKASQKVLVMAHPGSPGAASIRALRAAMTKEGAEMGALIGLGDPDEEASREAAAAGVYQSRAGGSAHPRVQVLTVQDLLAAKSIDRPRGVPEAEPRGRPRRREAEDAAADVEDARPKSAADPDPCARVAPLPSSAIGAMLPVPKEVTE